MRSVAAVMGAAAAVLLGSLRSSAQATVDADNSYPNVGALMVWRVDDSGKPVELRGFASGTLIGPMKPGDSGRYRATCVPGIRAAAFSWGTPSWKAPVAQPSDSLPT